MKRNNPQTGKPFKRGDVREDGFLFFSYQLSQLKKDGTHPEIWLKEETFKNDKKRAFNNHKKFSVTKEGRATKLLDNAKQRVKKLGGEVTITKDWVLKKLEKGRCDVTNLPFDLETTKTFRNPYAPSLDRIDNANRDYSPENTRVVLTAVNICLSDFGEEKLFPILAAMSQYIKDKKK